MRTRWGWQMVRLGVGIALGAMLLGNLWAQDRRGERGRWRERRPSEGGSPADPSARLQSRLERIERWIAAFDANQDGVIEPNEVQGQRRYIYERMAKETGLDPTQSIAVSEFRAAVARHIQQTAQQPKPPPGGPGGPPGAPSGGPPGEAKPAPPEASGPSASSGLPGTSPSGLRGFRTEGSNLSKPSGFGTSSAGNTPGVGTSGGMGTGLSGGSPAAGGPERRELEERVRQYAQSLLRRYDENKNGVLERNEWQNMRGSPEKGDRNNDGVITQEELVARLLDFSEQSSASSGGLGSSSPNSGASGSSYRPSGGGPPSGSSSSSSRSTTSTRSPERSRVRFLTPLERLPKGLPDWFVQKDADGDGQISMAEFATEWTDTKAAEFEKYDLNHDGIITPEECLQAEKSK